MNFYKYDKRFQKEVTIYDQYKVPNYYGKRWPKCKHSHLKSITTDGQPNFSWELCHNILIYFLDIWIGSLWKTFLVHTPVLSMILRIKLCSANIQEFQRIGQGLAFNQFPSWSLFMSSFRIPKLFYVNKHSVYFTFSCIKLSSFVLYSNTIQGSIVLSALKNIVINEK